MERFFRGRSSLLSSSYFQLKKTVQLRVEELEGRYVPSGDGLFGQYFDEIDLTSLADTRTDPTINFVQDWGNAPPGTAVNPDDNYSERWTGYVRIDNPGTWTFYTTSNDGVRLWVNDIQLIDHWNQHTVTEDSGSIQLDEGWYPIRLEHFQQNGTAEITLSFSGPSQSKTIIPQSHLCTTFPDEGQPVADAGADQFVVLPDNTVVLQGSGSDSDGTIVDYSWTQLSGPNSATLNGANTPQLTASNMVSGTYVFQLTVTDNDNNTDSDEVSVNVVQQGGNAQISGELKTWHRTTITFDGPNTSETASTNPFLDYRLNVTFTGPSNQTYAVPGFYAADGDAGNSHANSGNKWRVHFMPDEPGQWDYLASFRTGSNIAVNLTPTAGTPVGSIDGTAGSFTISSSDKTGSDFRAADKGLIKNRGDHYLTFASGNPFIKGGPNIPENLLGYEGFDNTPNANHDFDQHIQDWNPGDPDWDSDDGDSVVNDGRAIIGALNYISSQGANSIYFLPMNIGGDGKDTFPTIAEQNKTQYDVSKLDQWEEVFQHATSKGILLHFVLAETESQNENYHDNGNLGNQRKLFYRELIARFGHHPGVEFNIGEENDYGSTKHQQFADYIKSVDPYDHPVTTHTKGGQYDQFYNPLLGNGDFDITSFQGGNSRMSMANLIIDWRGRSENAGEKWAISFDEPQKIENDANDNNAGYPHGRRDKMWPVFMSGGAGFEWYVQQDGGGHSFDQQIDNFRDMDVALQWTGYALSFLENLPVMEMEPNHALGDSSSSGSNTYVLAKEGEIYGMYNDRSGSGWSLDLTGVSGSFEVKWFNPRNGQGFLDGTVTAVQGGTEVSLGNAPNTTNNDWAAIVSRVGDQAPVISVVAADANAAEEGTDSGQFTLSRTDSSGQLVVNYTISGSSSSSDYVENLNGSVTFVDGQTSVDLTITPIDDIEIEGDETVVLIIQPNTGYNIGSPSSATIVITDDDQAPVVSVVSPDANAAEQNNDPGQFTLSRDNANGQLQVNYTISGTANTSDYNETLSGSVTFVDGQSSVNLFVTPIDDTEDEDSETVILTIQPYSGYTIGVPSSATISIADNDEAPSGQQPFNGTPHVIADGSRIEAEEYDLGGPGVAYQDVDSSNNGNGIRQDEAVDIQTTSDLGGGYNVGWIRNGEFIEYTVDVQGGTYDIHARVASNNSNPGDLRVLIGDGPDGSNFTELGIFPVETTGGWQNWTTLTLEAISIPGGGQQVLRLEMIGNSFNINWLEFEETFTTPINQPPVVDAGPDQTITLPSTTASLDGTVTDDGLPSPGSVSVQWSLIDGPSSVTFGNPNAVDTTVSATQSGTYTLRLTADDGELTSFDEVLLVVKPEADVVTFTPVDDAFLQNGQRFNSSILRVEQASRVRISYLKFDVSGLDGRIVDNAVLRLQVSSDPGNGTVSISLGDSNNWTETNLTTSNAPTAVGTLSSKSGSFSDGSLHEFDVTNAITGNGQVSFIVTINSGSNDVAFSSKEGVMAPELVITSSSGQESVPQQPVLAVNSGGPQVDTISGDANFSGGRTYSTNNSIDTTNVSNPAPDFLYQSERYGNFQYTARNMVPGNRYQVRLHFAEIYWNTSGKRVFDVLINDELKLDDYDIFARTGGKYIAVVEAFEVVADAEGNILIDFRTEVDNAKVSGIEIIAL